MKAMQMMSALAHTTRWDVYRLLVDSLPDGMAASEVAEAVGMSRTAMSGHFAIMTAAGLLSAEKIGRTVIYKAETGPVEGLSDFLAHATRRGKAAAR